MLFPKQRNTNKNGRPPKDFLLRLLDRKRSRILNFTHSHPPLPPPPPPSTPPHPSNTRSNFPFPCPSHAHTQNIQTTNSACNQTEQPRKTIPDPITVFCVCFSNTPIPPVPNLKELAQNAFLPTLPNSCETATAAAGTQFALRVRDPRPTIPFHINIFCGCI